MTSQHFARVTGLVFCFAVGQLLVQGQAVTESKADQELNRKAQTLLSETMPLLRQLKNKDNQILSRLALAELQWKDQEKSARQLYREAFDLVRQVRANLDSDDESPFTETSVMLLRDRVIESLARHDTAMARQLFEQMRFGARSTTENSSTETALTTVQSNGAEYDRNLERSLAISAAADNPEEMVRLIRKELDSGLTPQITYLLGQLAEKDPQKAGSLMAEVIGKFRAINFESNPAAAEVASFLLTQALAGSPGNKKEDQKKEKAVIPLPPDLSQDIIESVTDAALDSKLTRIQDYLLYSLHSVIDEIERAAPAQAARLKKKFAELSKRDDDSSPYAQFEKSAANKEIAGMLQAARHAPAEMRDTLYSEAANAAWESGDKAQANLIAEKNISSAYKRNQLLRTFHEKAIADLIRKEDFVQARQLIQQTSSVERRAGQLIDLASAYLPKGDKKVALEILGEAQSLMPEKPTKQSELELEIKLANAFSKVDVDRSFALIGAAIEQINDISNATARMANFGSTFIPLQDGEFEIDSHIGVPGVDLILSREIHALAEADFEKTKKTLDKFERPEIRISAYLYLARTILEPADDCSCSCPVPATKSR